MWSLNITIVQKQIRVLKRKIQKKDRNCGYFKNKKVTVGKNLNKDKMK